MQKNNQEFFVLTVGHKNVRLYQGNHKALHQVTVNGLPADMKRTLGIDENKNERSIHSVIRAGRGTEVSASQYNAADTDKVMLREFFQRIDHTLHDYLTQRNLPLILAGVDYVRAIYKKANSYPHLVDPGIPGNQDNTKPNDLHQRALTILHQTSAKS